jgi:hypothetical protein
MIILKIKVLALGKEFSPEEISAQVLIYQLMMQNFI